MLLLRLGVLLILSRGQTRFRGSYVRIEGSNLVLSVTIVKVTATDRPMDQLTEMEAKCKVGFIEKLD